MKLIQYLLVLAALVFLGHAFIDEWQVIRELQWELNPYLFTGALSSLILLYVVDAFGWHLILQSLGADIRVGTSIPIWIISSLTRYVPGVVWAYANRIIWANKHGVGMVRGSTSMLMENVLLAISSLLIGLPALVIALHFEQNMLLFVCLAGAMTFSLHPCCLSLLRFLPGKLGRSFSEMTYPPFSKILSLLLFYLLFWALFSFVFVLFSTSLFALPHRHFLFLGTAFSASFGIGFIIIIFPGGIGIREATLYTILTTILPDSTALILALGSRAWLLLGEFLCVVLTSLYLQWTKIRFQNMRL